MILKENKTSQTSSNSDPKTKSALLDKYEKENAELKVDYILDKKQ
jgi:hypothetical protein